jgi:levanase/fructan beta-fructosidase
VLVHADGKYSMGSFNGTKFTEESERFMMDIGGQAFYATQTFENVQTGDGRRIQMAWMRGSNFPGQPFSQQVTFPCELKLKNTRSGLRIFRQPVRELSLLADQVKNVRGGKIHAGEVTTVCESGEAYRIEANVEIPPNATVVFNVRGTQVRLGKTELKVGDSNGKIQEDVSKVEILVDRASLEVFVNDGQISCSKVLRPSAPGTTVTVEGSSGATVDSLRLTTLKGMWPK